MPRNVAAASICIALMGPLLLAAPARAASPVAGKPINIEADSAEYSQRTGVSVYRGQVVLDQGGLELRGDTLTITRNPDTGAIRALLEGAPAKLRKEPDRNSEDLVTGHASQMEYISTDQVVVLQGDALVERGGDIISGETIRHNINSATTEAQSASEGERVRITIQPETAEQGRDGADAAAPPAETNP